MRGNWFLTDRILPYSRIFYAVYCLSFSLPCSPTHPFDRSHFPFKEKRTLASEGRLVAILFYNLSVDTPLAGNKNEVQHTNLARRSCLGCRIRQIPDTPAE